MNQTFFSRPVELPATRREGLANFVQIIINKIEEGDHREALLEAVDLHQDITSGIYDDTMPTGTETPCTLISQLRERHAAELAEARDRAYAEGMADGTAEERRRLAVTLGLDGA